MPWSSSPAAAAVSTTRAATSVSTWSRAAVGLEVAYAEPAGLERRRGVGAPAVEEQLGAAYELEGGAGGGAVDRAGPRSEVASAGGCVERAPGRGVAGPAATVHGRRRGARRAGPAARGDQLGGGPGAAAPAAVGPRLDEVVEDRPGLGLELGEQRRAPRRGRDRRAGAAAR